MIPVFEQGSGKGIGHSLESFLRRFDEICSHQIREARALSFAFIFYDFSDSSMRRILKDQGVFAKLDRLSGDKLSIFYLHTSNATGLDRFNTFFLSKFGLADTADLPCVVFFKIENGEFSQIEAVCLDSADLIHGFQELYGVLEKYVTSGPRLSPPERYLRTMKGVARFATTEVVRETIRAAIRSVLS